MQITLEQPEAALLQQILENHLGDLRMEIGKTENYDMRQDLKQREATLRALEPLPHFVGLHSHTTAASVAA